MEEKIYLYPVWVRVWHWLNALLFLGMVLTGLSMQYAGHDTLWIPFGLSVSIHNICGISLIAVFLFFLFTNRFSSNGVYYKIPKTGFANELWQQIRYYSWGIFKKEPHPFDINKKRKFNPLQLLSYVVAMYILVPLIIITGLGLLFPEITINKIFGASGIFLTDLLHQLTGVFLIVFWMIHLYFCTIGKTATSNFKSMVTGWH